MGQAEVSIFINIVYLCFKVGVASNSVSLDPTVADVRENTSLTFRCSNDGPEMFKQSRWTFSKESVNGVIDLNNGSCVTSGYLSNSSLYMCNCHDNGTYSVTLKKVDRKQNGAFWICRQGNMESNIVYLTVKVPVETVEINRPTRNSVSIKENSCATFQCNTSYSSPSPTVTWLFDKVTSDAGDDREIVDGVLHSNRINADGLVSTTATFILKANQTMTGWRLYCTANNTLHQNVKSRRVILNVIFSSDMVPKQSDVTLISLGALSSLLLMVTVVVIVIAIGRGRKLSKIKSATNPHENIGMPAGAMFPVYDDIDPSKVSRQPNIKPKLQPNKGSYERLNSVSGPLYAVTSFSTERADNSKTEQPTAPAYTNLRLSYFTGKHAI